MFKHEHGAGASFGVKAFLIDSETGQQIQRIGDLDFHIDGKRSANLRFFDVNESYQNRGIGSKMVKLSVDYMTDGIAKEINGDITFSKDLEKLIKIFKKNGFSINEKSEVKHTEIDIALSKPMYSEFHELHKVEPATRKEYYFS